MWRREAANELMRKNSLIPDDLQEFTGAFDFQEQLGYFLFFFLFHLLYKGLPQRFLLILDY